MDLFRKLSRIKWMSDVVRKNRILKTLLKSVYMGLLFPFTRKGVNVDIGGVGSYKLDYNFSFSRYEEFGDKHNAGFNEWVKYCKNKKAVFDVGAHIGLYTLPASRAIAAGGAVYAFEPSEANRRYLRRHLDYNGISNVTVLPYVVGGVSKKECEFYENRKTDPMNSVNPKKNINRFQRVTREQINLDDFSAKHSLRPEAIKIDVEGAEYDVLKGARTVIERFKPVVFLSVHPDRLAVFNTSAEELMELVNHLGYVARDYNNNEMAGFVFGEYVLTPRN